MNERQLFESALEISDPHARQAFLDQACHGDANLKTKVDALLRCHAMAGSFLEIPAADQVQPEADQGTTNTIVLGRTGEHEDERIPAEAQFRKYLQPATRPGWLGRLAHYEIEATLGQGAFGTVAKAFDEKLHRVVAIKLMRPELASTSPPRKRFLREARTAAAVMHENIVAIHAVEEEPIPYLVMEYVPGITLQQWMDEHGPLEPPEILRIGQQVAAGLAAAHEVNLIHRDIKPSNILLTGGPHERAKISDFGLARAVDDAAMTSSGLIAGTPLYMAPEQARGETLDHRADLFSLGSVLYQLASGRPPFRGANTIAVLKRVCEDTPRPLDDVLPGFPDWLETIIFKLLEKERDDRYQTAQEVADLLSRCQRELEHNGKVTCVASRTGATAETQVVSKAASASSVPDTKSKASRSTKVYWIAPFLVLFAVTGGLLLNHFNPTGDVEKGRAEIPVANVDVVEQRSGWRGWPADAPKPAIAPFNPDEAWHHQDAWAKYLNVPVEYENSLGMKFRLIPPGEFMMGSTPKEIDEILKQIDPNDKQWQEFTTSEGPQHKVVLTQPIYLGVIEVRQADYERVMGVNPSHFAPMGTGKEAVAGLETNEHPVELVSWNDAAEFCVKLSQQEKLKPFYFRAGETTSPLHGTGYRLPSEAVWEFACRAGATTKHWNGNQGENLVGAAWFNGNAGGRTHVAGELKANPFGVHDTHGNVSEWVEDSWDASWYSQFQEKPAINPTNPFAAGSRRVIRGGDWNNPASVSRSSFRFGGVPSDPSLYLGFRVSLPVEAVRQSSKSTGSCQRSSPTALASSS